MSGALPRSWRATKQAPPLAIQQLAVRPEPKLSDIATALAALHKNIQALSQQLDHLEHDTVNDVNNYIYEITNFISDNLNANFGEIRDERPWLHRAIPEVFGG
jgi:hypothetical protein